MDNNFTGVFSMTQHHRINTKFENHGLSKAPSPSMSFPPLPPGDPGPCEGCVGCVPPRQGVDTIVKTSNGVSTSNDAKKEESTASSPGSVAVSVSTNTQSPAELGDSKSVVVAQPKAEGTFQDTGGATETSKNQKAFANCCC